MLLAAGALLVGALAASLLAVRVRVPSLALFLGIGMLIGSDALDWVQFDNYKLARTIGIVALALILFEGGLAVGPAATCATCSARPPAWRSSARWSRPSITGLRGRRAVRLLDPRGAAARRDPRLHRRRGDLRAAARLDAQAPAGDARSRRESGLNDPVALLLVLGFINWLDQPWLRNRRHGVAVRARARHRGVVIGMAVGWLATQALRRARLATAGLYPVASLATVALAYGAADVAARLGLPRRLPRGARGRAASRSRRSRRSRTSTRAWLGGAARACSWCSGCSCSRASSATSRSRARSWRWCSWSWRDRPRPLLATLPFGLQRAASACCSAGPACAGRCRWCSRPSR